MGVRVKVLDLLPGGRAIVSTRGFCRVVIKPGDEIAVELVNPTAAKFYAEAFNSVSTKRRAVVERYKSPK